ncbi:hypothetical protein BGW41_001253 [Actinomortierella wolfii]|nr:hypothetical protein BGW41_001253 [Actinomortierella wolfii]
MSRAQPCPSMNPTKPQQSIQRRLHTNARLCHLAQTLFGSQGIQDLAIVGVLFGNNIHQIGRFQIQCNGTMSQGMFSIHELVNSRVLAVSGRSKKGRKAGRRRRQLKKQQLSSSKTDHEAPLTPPSELSKNHHHQHQQQRHSFFSPLPPPITTGRSSSSSRPPSFTPGTSSPSAQTAVASTSSSNSCPPQEPWSFGSLTPSDRLLGDNYDLRGGEASFSYDLSPPNDDELVVSSPDVLRRLFQRCLFHVPDLPLPDELCFLAAASFPLPQSLRALHVAWTMEFLKRRMRTERRSRQQERRMAKTPSSHGSPNNHHRHSSTGLFQRSPDMITVMEEECDEEEEKENETLTVKDGIKQDYDVPTSPTASAAAVAVAAAPQHTSSQSQSTAKSACLGGLEFRPEVYAYKMRLARAARARSSKQSASAASSRSNSTTTNDNSSATQPSQTCQSTAADDAASAAETNSSSSQPSTPVVDTHNTMTNDPPSTQDSPSTFPTIEILKLQQDKERPDKRLMQQLLSLENKVPRIVRKWAHHARHFFAEELMREDSLAQKWVDEQRIEVVLGTGCHGHLPTFVSSSAHHLQQQQQQQQQTRLSSSATTAFAMHTASHTPPSPPSLPLPAHDNQQQQQQQHQCQSHVPPAAHMQQQQVQEAMTNTSNMHTTNMMTTTTTIATTATTTIMTDTTTTSNNTSTHSQRLITGCSTPVAASTPRITSFAEGIRLSHQNDSMVDFGMSSATVPSSSGITSGHHRSSLRNSFQNLGAAATSTMTSSAGSVSSGVPQFYPYHHRVSTSQQMLSLHLWLSCLVSPISPDQLVHEGYFEPLDPQVYP